MDLDEVSCRRDLRIFGLQKYNESSFVTNQDRRYPRLFSALLHGRLIHQSRLLSTEVILPLFGIQTCMSKDVSPAKILLTLLDVNTNEKNSIQEEVENNEYKKIDAYETEFVLYNHEQLTKSVFPRPTNWISDACHLAPGRKVLLERIITTHSGGNQGGGVLIAGPPGFGKKTLAMAVAKASHRPIFRIRGPSLYSGELGETEEKLMRLFDAARNAAPSCILLESCELVLSSRSSLSLLTRRCAASIFRAMDKLTNQGVFWIASCTTDISNKSILPVQSRAFGPSRFSHVIYTETLSQNDRYLILQALLSKFPQSDLCEISEFLSLRTNGYSPADLSLLASTLMSSFLKSINDFKNLVEMKKECHKVLSIVRPSLLNDAIGSLSRDVSLSQVFGMEDAIKRASQAVLLPLQHPHLFQQIGSIAPNGLLLHGPSGCGKTHLAHAIANHASATLKLCNALVVQGPDIISARLGSSEASLSTVFARARELRPCILIFDQFEIIAPRRASVETNSSGTSALSGDRLLSLLLTEMDGLDSKNNDKGAQMPVIVIAITHDIRLLDRAVLRPGRLDIHISISNPTDQERQELIKSLFSKSPLSLPPDFVENIVKRTLGWSRAKIVGLWEAAAMEAVRRSCSVSTAVQEESSINISSITEADLEMAFKV